MQIPKEQVIDMLRDTNQPGDPTLADQAAQELPQHLDTDDFEHQNQLQRFGVDPQHLVNKFAGGGGSSFGM